MTPEEVVRPFQKHFTLPESVAQLLTLLIQREIERDLYDPLPYAEGLNRIFSKLPPLRDLGTGLHASIAQLAGLTESDMRHLHRIPHPFLTDLLNFNVGFDLPHRNEHCHIIAAPGAGKTELIKKLVAEDIASDSSVIVMAPKGDLISTLAKLPSNRTIYISDWTQVGLNLFDLDTSHFVYVFASLLDAPPTPKQKALLSLALKEVKTFDELRAYLKRPPDKNYNDTGAELSWRLDLLFSNPLIGQIFSRETNVNVREVMEEGKVLLIDTSIKTLGDTGSSFIGRYFIALIARATHQKQTKRPCYVYIDECATYITDYIEDLLDRAREANVGLILAHQHLAQLTPKLRQSIHNTALKFVGRVNADDAGEMAKQMRVPTEAVLDLPRLTFLLSGVVKPFTVKIIPGEINKLATQHRDHFTSTIPESVPPQSTQTGKWKW